MEIVFDQLTGQIETGHRGYGPAAHYAKNANTVEQWSERLSTEYAKGNRNSHSTKRKNAHNL